MVRFYRYLNKFAQVNKRDAIKPCTNICVMERVQMFWIWKNNFSIEYLAKCYFSSVFSGINTK